MTDSALARTLLAFLVAGSALAAPQVPAPQGTQTLPSSQDQILQQFFQSTPDAMQSTWVRQPQGRRPVFTGFPTAFPPRLSGYGTYPADPNAATTPGQSAPSPGVVMPSPLQALLPAPLVPGAAAAAEPRGWPAQVGSTLPYEPSVALLVQHVQRVWWHKAGETVQVPLFFHDKFALTTSGCGVEVRQAGGFELLLHETGRIVAHGPTRLEIVKLDAERVDIAIGMLTRLRLVVTGREQRYELPDGSYLLFPAVAPTADAPATVGDVVLERPFEPGWLAGRCSFTNLGDRVVQWHGAAGSLELKPGERASVFLSRPKDAIGAELVGKDVAVVREGRVATARANTAAAVSWCGASFDLGAGSSLRIDPLQGDPFPAERQKAP